MSRAVVLLTMRLPVLVHGSFNGPQLINVNHLTAVQRPLQIKVYRRYFSRVLYTHIVKVFNSFVAKSSRVQDIRNLDPTLRVR